MFGSRPLEGGLERVCFVFFKIEESFHTVVSLSGPFEGGFERVCLLFFGVSFLVDESFDTIVSLILSSCDGLWIRRFFLLGLESQMVARILDPSTSMSLVF